MEQQRDRFGALALIGAVVLALAGAALTFSVAQTREDAAASRARESRAATAADIGSQVGIQLDASMVALRSVRALAAVEPRMTQSRFAAWASAFGGRRRGSNLSILAAVRVVPDRELPGFQRRTRADPAYRAMFGGRPMVVQPAGKRASYCLTTGAVLGGRQLNWTPLFDFCAPKLPLVGTNPYLETWNRARDGGDVLVGADPWTGTVFGVAPVYEPGRPIGTRGERRAAFVGFAAVTIDLRQAVRAALGEHRGYAVAVAYAAGREAALVRLGDEDAVPVRRARPAAASDLVVQVAGPALTRPRHTQTYLVGGAVTLLAVTLLMVLARSRARAMRLVRLKTRELAHTATHDALTGLPNRRLLREHTLRLLATAAEAGRPAGALYLDIDGFKAVNDGFGHGAGDALLVAVAERLRTVTRESDVVGRVGGDEFVVLPATPADTEHLEAVGRRIVDAMRAPFVLDCAPAASVSVSVGVAVGDFHTPDALMRAADDALYEAKRRGKDQVAGVAAR